jgi:glycosyltransferase involved in cell wall biosynthesis
MGTLEAGAVRLRSHYRIDHPLAVLGITHSQTCLVLRGRLRALREAGFRVVLISSPGELADQLAAEEGVDQIAIPMHRSFAPLADLVSFFRLWAALRRLRPALTEFSTPKAGFLGSIAAFLCGVPMRIYMLRGLRLETAAGVKRRVLRTAEWFAASCSHTVVCNSASLRDEARALGLASESKLRLIARGSSNGVDVQRFAPGQDEVRARLGIAADAHVVGFVGRLTRDKGVPELLDAFDRLLESAPTARLLLVGWFDESEDALSPQQRARIANHPAIVHTGFVADAAPYYRAMDMMVLPTWREGFPNVVLEAAATGIPVITTLTTGARDAVLPGLTGLLVPPGDPRTLAESMLRLLRHPRRRVAMGRAARRWVVQQFIDTRVLGLTIALYKELLHDAETEAIGALVKGVAAVAD